MNIDTAASILVTSVAPTATTSGNTPKYEMVKDHPRIWGVKTLYRIRALRSFTTNCGVEIRTGDFGGWVEKESNLSQQGNSWICDNGIVCDDACILDDACVHDDAYIYGHGVICHNAEIYGRSVVCDDAVIFGNASAYGNARIGGNSRVYGIAEIFENAEVYGYAEIYGGSKIHGEAYIGGNEDICKDADVTSALHTFSISHIGECGSHMTMFRTSHRDIGITMRGEYYTPSEFIDFASTWREQETEIALSALALGEKYITIHKEG